MANKEALRELQHRLAERLRTARTRQRGRAWLAVDSGGHGFLLPLAEAGETFAQVPPLLPVPHTERWFLGVANLRGHLHGVVDLADFLGLTPNHSLREGLRLVGFNPTLGLNCALRVDALAGLRNADELVPDADDAGPRPAFVGDRHRDATGRLWQELSLAGLAADRSFLGIVG